MIRRSYLKRGQPPKRSSKPIARSRIKKRPRRPSEYARIYGSKARVAWVKSLGCIACALIAPIFGFVTRGSSHNAHTVNGGTGYKADHTTIVPLCAGHHARYDQHQYPFDRDAIRQIIKDGAAQIENLWQESQRGVA